MIDKFIVGLYLIGVLAWGLYKGRGVKDFKDYSLGARRFAAPVVIATITATCIGGGSTIGGAAQYYTMGILILLAPFCDAMGVFFISKFLVPHMHRFKGALSLGEVFRKHYGKRAQVSVGVLGTIFNVGIVAAQVSATGYVFQDFLGIPYELGVCIAFGVMVAYSAFGGFRSVVATDVIQFAILIIAIPLIANYAIHLIGGYPALWRALPESHLSFWPTKEAVFKYWPAFLAFLIPPLDPAIFQRMLMSGNTKMLRDSFKISAIITIPSALIVATIGLSGLVLYPEINAHTVVPHLIANILPIGMKGLAVAGLLAVVMSTADSSLNAAAISVVNDIIKPFSVRGAQYNYLRITRLSCVLLGLFSVLIALQFTVIFDLVRYSWMVWSPVVIPPLMLLFWGKAVQKGVFLSGAAAAIATVFAWSWIFTGLSVYIEAFFPALFMNTFILCVFGLLGKSSEKDVSSLKPASETL